MTIAADDTALLEALGAALAPAPISPSDDEVLTLRALVTSDDVLVALPAPRATRHPLRHVVAVAAAVVALAVGAGLVALSTGSSLPDRLRAPARALGLPVDSAAVAETRAAMAALRDALAQPDDARVARARSVLDARLSRLDRDELAAVSTDARALLARADARLRAPAIADPAGASRPPTGSSVTPDPSESSGSSTIEPNAGGGPATSPSTTAEPSDVVPGSTVTTEPAEDTTEPHDDGE